MQGAKTQRLGPLASSMGSLPPDSFDRELAIVRFIPLFLYGGGSTTRGPEPDSYRQRCANEAGGEMGDEISTRVVASDRQDTRLCGSGFLLSGRKQRVGN